MRIIHYSKKLKEHDQHHLWYVDTYQRWCWSCSFNFFGVVYNPKQKIQGSKCVDLVWKLSPSMGLLSKFSVTFSRYNDIHAFIITSGVWSSFFPTRCIIKKIPLNMNFTYAPLNACVLIWREKIYYTSWWWRWGCWVFRHRLWESYTVGCRTYTRW